MKNKIQTISVVGFINKAVYEIKKKWFVSPPLPILLKFLLSFEIRWGLRPLRICKEI